MVDLEQIELEQPHLIRIANYIWRIVDNFALKMETERLLDEITWRGEK